MILVLILKYIFVKGYCIALFHWFVLYHCVLILRGYMFYDEVDLGIWIDGINLYFYV